MKIVIIVRGHKVDKFQPHIDGLLQDCSNSIADTLELLQSCTKTSIYTYMSYTRVFATSTGCLRSIDPSLGIKQPFGDITKGQWHHS